MRAGVDDDRLSAEPLHHLRHLDADRARAEDHHAARHLRHGGGLTAGPYAIQLTQPGNRGHEGRRSSGQDDMVGGVARAVDLDDAEAGQVARAAEQRDVVVGEPLLLPRVGVVGDHEVAPRERSLDVHVRGRQRVTCATTASPGRSSVLDGMHA